MLWLSEHGYKVKMIEAFDYQRFSREGKEYIYSEFGTEIGRSQEKHADIAQGVLLSKKLICKSIWTKKIPELNNIKELLKSNYLVICNVNAAKLNQQDGYEGHFVIVKGFDEDYLEIHDPGLPPYKDRIVDNEVFNEAWSFPNQNARNIKAIKLHRNKILFEG